MIKAIAATVLAMAVGMTLSWLLLNFATGCALVNDWGHPDCLTPLDLFKAH